MKAPTLLTAIAVATVAIWTLTFLTTRNVQPVAPPEGQ